MSAGLRRSNRLPQADDVPGPRFSGTSFLILQVASHRGMRIGWRRRRPTAADDRCNKAPTAHDINCAQHQTEHDIVPACSLQAGPKPFAKMESGRDQERESSESPMLNAFCRVAPSVLFNFLAILAAGVFLRAMVLSSRTSPEVHARRFFDFLGINPPYIRQAVGVPWRGRKKSKQIVFRS